MTDEGFNEPVLRCLDCGKVVELHLLTKYGMCTHCGSRQVKALQTMSEDEYGWLKKNYPVFAAEFKGEEL